LLKVSGNCRIPANARFFASSLFPAFQEIHSGYCTVVAHLFVLGLVIAGLRPVVVGIFNGEIATKKDCAEVVVTLDVGLWVLLIPPSEQSEPEVSSPSTCRLPGHTQHDQ
jgi:hypothetical protein